MDMNPMHYDRSEDVPGTPPGTLSSYESNWTVADYMNAIMDAGCDLVAIDEFGDQAEAWE